MDPFACAAALSTAAPRLDAVYRAANALAEIGEELKRTLRPRLQDAVTKWFRKIADPAAFSGAEVGLDEKKPMLRLPPRRGTEPTTIEVATMSGFERRTFGIAFTLALAEISGRRLPLVIDTPLGNADSDYRRRTLQVLTEAPVDQVVLLFHDEEIGEESYARVADHVGGVCLVEKDDQGRSRVQPGRFFFDTPHAAAARNHGPVV